MAYYVDKSGELWEFDDPKQAEKNGLRPAGDEDVKRHNDREAAREAPTQAFGEQAARSGLTLAEIMGQGGDPNARFGGVEAEQQRAKDLEAAGKPIEPIGAKAARVHPSLYTDEAKSRSRGYTEDHPVLSGIAQDLPVIAGTSLMLPGAGTAAALADVALGGMAGGHLQEVEQAWAENREYSEKAALANGGLNVLFGGGLYGGGRLAGAAYKAAKPRVGAFTRNLLAEAEGAADAVLGPVKRAVGMGDEAAPAGREFRSAGSAAAADYDDAINQALTKLTDNEAATIAYDAEHYQNLITSQVRDKLDQVDAVVNSDLTVGVKNEDWAIGAESWTPRMQAEQERYFNQLRKDSAGLVDLVSSAGKAGYNFKGAAAAVVEDVEGAMARINETYGAERNQALDALKRQLDKRLDQIADKRDTSISAADRTKLVKGYLRPFVDEIRGKLEDESLFGNNALLQQRTNAGLHKFLDPWKRIQRRVYEVTGKEWGEIGAGRMKRRADASAILSALRENPTLRKAFDQDFAEALEGLEMVVEGRKAAGFTHQEALDPLLETLAELKAEWNMGSLVNYAVSKTADSDKRGKGLKAVLETLADVTPGGGIAKRMVLLGSKMREGGAPRFNTKTGLGRVMNEAFTRWSKNGDVDDVTIFRPDWLRSMLDGYRGRQIANEARPRTPVGDVPISGPPSLGARAGEIGKRNADKIMGAGLVTAAGAGGGDEDGEGVMTAGLGGGDTGRALLGVAGAALLGGKGLAEALERFRGSGRKLGSWSTRMGSANLDHAANPFEVLAQNGASKRTLQALEKRLATEPLTAAAVDEARHIELAKANEALWSPEERSALEDYGAEGYREVNAALREKDLTDPDVASKVATMRGALDKAIAAGNTAPGIVHRGIALSYDELDKLTQSATVAAQGFMSTATNVRRAGIFTDEVGKQPVLLKIEQRTGVPVDVAGEEEILLRPGTKFEIVDVTETRRPGDDRRTTEVHLRETGYSPKGAATQAIVAGGLLGIGAMGAADDAGAAELEPQLPPEHAAALRSKEAMLRIGEANRELTKRAVQALLSDDEGAARSPAHMQLDKRAEKLGVSMAMARFLGRKNDDPIRAWSTARDRLAKLTSDPEAFGAELASLYGSLPDAQPESFMAISAHAARVAQYLFATCPTPVGKSLFNPKGYPPPDELIEEWAERWSGATVPQDTLQDVASGDASPAQLEAVRANWPELYSDFQLSALNELQARARRGREVPFERLVYLDMVLDLQGQADPMLSWEMADLIAQAEQSTPKEQKQAPQMGGAQQQRSVQPAALAALQGA
jgi:hypothetical protein